MDDSGIVDLTQGDSRHCYLGADDGDDDDVFIVSVRPPDKKIKCESATGRSADDDACAESVVAPTSAYTEVSGAPGTLMVLTEGRGAASEIAYCLFNMATSQCTLSQFADSASYSRTIYALVTSRPQMLLVPKAMAGGRSKAMLSIRRYLPWLAVVPLERRRFNDSEGAGVLQNIAIPCQVVQLTRALHTKHYAYAALNAMFYHLEHDLEVVVASGSVNVVYRQMEGAMQIDPGAWRDLDLECSHGGDGSKGDRSLLQAIDHTSTKMGRRLLHANILQPLTDLSTIYARQGAVLEILDSEELFFSLSSRLAEVPDIDATIASIVRLPAAASSRQVSQAISNVIHVKHILQVAADLAASFAGDPRSALLGSIVGVLADARVGDLLGHIHSVVREDITLEKSAQMTRSQRCHAVKDGVDGFLDVSRAIFDKVTQDVVRLVEQYSNEVQVPIKAVYKPSVGYIMTARRDALGESIPEEFVNVKLNGRLSSVVAEINILTEKAIQGVASVIRENIVVLYRVSEAVALLDMLVSFAHHCTLHECVVPEFSDSINIVDGRHPILEAIGREVVPNSISTTAATFTVVSGPNMGGKSTYLRQLIYLVIMAQIGSLVPAQSASLKVFDKLFVRMNNNDSVAASESTFLCEMRDIAYILQNYDRHSLVVIDELGRSTAAAEGKAICRAVCEELVDSAATVLLTTHFLDLPAILGQHPNCARVALSEMAPDGQVGGRFKATAGAQSEAMYGIRLAERMGFPSAAIDVAKDVVREVHAKRAGKQPGAGGGDEPGQEAEP
ncbi:MutS protein msh4 [Coemansia javaensis]|uniref:MutS protein msh4 n=1 Tax=Coemansia javaensis TaxID=2761396 RepID=A0A9W8HBS0_9FUNG|nr:MutS protein msh4 [Coemansia javaensis]